MAIQKYLNQQAIDMLPRCSFFLKEFGGNNHNLLRAISNSSTPLSLMTAQQINEFDEQQLTMLIRQRMSPDEVIFLDNLQEQAR